MPTTDDNRPASAGNVKAGIADAMAGLKSEMGGGYIRDTIGVIDSSRSRQRVIAYVNKDTYESYEIGACVSNGAGNIRSYTVRFDSSDIQHKVGGESSISKADNGVSFNIRYSDYPVNEAPVLYCDAPSAGTSSVKFTYLVGIK